MTYWLDLIGSYIIAGAIILMIGKLNIYILNSANESMSSNLRQLTVTTSADIINYDFYKIGYRITGDKIVEADEDKIKFYSDIDDNGAADTIYYYTGNVSELSSTPNPSDKLLYRILNNEAPLSSNAVTDFKLTYYDSSNTEISYGKLNSQNWRDYIKTIKIYLKVESPEPVDTAYQVVEWQKKITPKNL
ncbi:MAG: hypothetical protein COW08_05195 [Ignavibacteriales bacterium CG12_big_fil_rev_8_21_14_0_65_30_8]|nr:MAG: hypothetical protein COW08_05195 [Ignavibacteriales bacterium CG12_big_fil_rev_8_21_14_0_65_30_8]